MDDTPVTGLPQVGELGALDYVVIALMLLISSGIGLYYRCTGGRQATLQEYMMADRSMSVLPVAFSLMASFMSAITLLGLVQEMYMYGTMFIMINISYIIATPIVCYFYLPVFFRLQKTSVYEYLELRFGYPTRLCASIAFSLQMILYMGIVLYAPALALSAVTGLSRNLCILVVGSVCTFYSALGGIKAVLITDVMQSLLMFAAVGIVLVTGLQSFSVSEVFQIAGDSGRLQFFVLDPDPRVRTTLWTQVIGGCFTYLSLYGVNQTQVQRLLTIRSLRKSQCAVWLEWPILMVLSLTTSFAGLLIYAHYKDCDPLLAGIIHNSDQLLPQYVVQFANSTPGITGLFIAGVFSGSLSTVSSSLNSLSAVTISDYIEPLIRKLRPGTKVALPAHFAPLISVCFGIVCIGIAFLTAVLGSGVLQASLTVFGAVGGPLLGLFTLAMTTTRANEKGALPGLILGLFLSLWIGFGQPKPAPEYMPRSTDGCYTDNYTTIATTLATTATTTDTTTYTPPPGDDFNFLHEMYAISYAWIGAIGFFITYIIGLLLSILMAKIYNQHPKVSRRLLANCCGGGEEKCEDGEGDDLQHSDSAGWNDNFKDEFSQKAGKEGRGLSNVEHGEEKQGISHNGDWLQKKEEEQLRQNGLEARKGEQVVKKKNTIVTNGHNGEVLTAVTKF